MSSTIPLLLFAKAPIAGKVKTRLQTHCTPQQCAEIAKILLEASVKKVSECWPGDIYLSVWLDRDHDFIKTLTAKYEIGITEQCAGDLGDKMHHALETFGYPAAVMGADAPHMKPKELDRAHQLLQQGRSTIGVSEDGGYYFIGLSNPASQIFKHMRWGNEQVLAETMLRAEQIDLELTPLEVLQDVDEWPDLIAAAAQLPPLAAYLHSAGLL